MLALRLSQLYTNQIYNVTDVFYIINKQSKINTVHWQILQNW